MSRTKGIGRRFGLVATIALLGVSCGGASAVAQMPGGSAREALERDFPGVGVLERGERVSAVFGRPMTRGATARAAMEDWMDLYQPVFGVEGLEWDERFGAEISGGRVAFALRQEVTVEGGILSEPMALPVEGGRLRALVATVGEGFAVIYVAARVADIDGSVAAPQITGAQAIAAAGEDERTQHLKVWGEPELVVVEVDLGAGPEVFAAWRLAGQESEEASLSSLIVHVDAVTGAVVKVGPGFAHAADPVTGTVEGKATSGLGPPLTSTVATVPLPDLIVKIVGESSTTTDFDGNYELATTSSSVDVEAALDAGYWTVLDSLSLATPTLSLTGVLPPASGQDFLFPGGNLTVEKVALVNSYVEAQKSNEFFRQRVSTWASVLSNQLPPIDVRPNHNCGGHCNAFFDFGNLEMRLCTAAAGCHNAAMSTIISHEYGHYIARFLIGEFYDTAGHAFHEGYSDSHSMLVHNTDIIGLDWLLPTPSVVRQPSIATVTYPACSGSAHARGELLGWLWWDIRLELDEPMEEPDNTRLLFVDWTMLTSGAAAPHDDCPSWPGSSEPLGQPADLGTLIEVLTADDDDSDLSNGTPNSAVICQAFSDRGIESPPGLGLCPLPLRGGGTCKTDLNYDGVLDIFDFLEFQNMFAAGDMFCDFNGDGELDFFDFLAFQAEYAAGCW